MERVCANCGCKINGEYYKSLDNYLQVNYFDDEGCNCFCSQECFCDSLFLELIYVDNEEEEANNE